MKPLVKIILVVAGYLAAFVIASVVVSLYIAATNGPDRQADSGMYAFGDSILFLGVCGVAAIPATGAALFFLRPYHLIWRLFAAGALGITLTGIGDLVDFLVPQNVSPSSFLGVWSMLSPIRILLTPLFVIACFLGALFAPTRFTRLAFLSAAAIEAVVFGGVALIWFQPFR
jgi:hypothetical protein